MKMEGQNKVQVINWDNHRHRTNTFDNKCQKGTPVWFFFLHIKYRPVKIIYYVIIAWFNYFSYLFVYPPPYL